MGHNDLSVLPRRLLWGAVVVGLAGQLAWTVENMYLNVFVYNTITDSPQVIATLVAASAIVATIATLVIGAYSDRVGARRPFVAIGYLAWGVITASFGFFGGDGALVHTAAAAATTIIVLDCVMSFFGAGANDAAFNAWITDSTNSGNRGRIDAIMQVLPLVGMLVVFGALDGLTQAGNWRAFFGVVGVATSAVGILAWFLVQDSPSLRRTSTPYVRSLVEGLRPSTVRAHPRLYIALVAWAFVGTAVQTYMPYIIIYLQRRLQIDGYAVVLGSVIITASLLSVVGGRIIDRAGKVRSIIPALALLAAGLVLMFFARSMIPVILAGIVAFTGMIVATAAISATVRDATPSGSVGMIQGIRMIASVLIPMVVGPFLGASVISGAGETYVDLGVTKQVPTPWIFLAAAAVALLAMVPSWWLARVKEHR